VARAAGEAEGRGVKRYAVKGPDGRYSRGGERPDWSDLDGAKLWRTRGHVTQHLQTAAGRYPAGTIVVEVSVVASEEPLIDVARFHADFKARKDHEKREREARWVEQELRSAEQRLAEAKARAARLA
jgi:hypothetical protein